MAQVRPTRPSNWYLSSIALCGAMMLLHGEITWTNTNVLQNSMWCMFVVCQSIVLCCMFIDCIRYYTKSHEIQIFSLIKNEHILGFLIVIYGVIAKKYYYKYIVILVSHWKKYILSGITCSPTPSIGCCGH